MYKVFCKPKKTRGREGTSITHTNGVKLLRIEGQDRGAAITECEKKGDVSKRETEQETTAHKGNTAEKTST